MASLGARCYRCQVCGRVCLMGHIYCKSHRVAYRGWLESLEVNWREAGWPQREVMAKYEQEFTALARAAYLAAKRKGKKVAA